MKNLKLILSIAILLLVIDNIRLRSKIEQTAIDSYTLTRIENELDLMKVRLKIPSAIVEKTIPKVLAVESNFITSAVADGGKSHGLGQVQLKTAQYTLGRTKISVEDLYSPFVNPFIATLYLDLLYKQHRDIKMAISGYNGGLKKDSTGILRITNTIYVSQVERR